MGDGNHYLRVSDKLVKSPVFRLQYLWQMLWSVVVWIHYFVGSGKSGGEWVMTTIIYVFVTNLYNPQS